MEPVEPLKYNGFTIEREEYPFLTRFLSKFRSIDMPFPKRHQLITYIHIAIQNSCYDFVLRHFPDHLIYTQIICFDQIDIFDWTAFIEASQMASRLYYTDD